MPRSKVRGPVRRALCGKSPGRSRRSRHCRCPRPSDPFSAHGPHVATTLPVPRDAHTRVLLPVKIACARCPGTPRAHRPGPRRPRVFRRARPNPRTLNTKRHPVRAAPGLDRAWPDVVPVASVPPAPAPRRTARTGGVAGCGCKVEGPPVRARLRSAVATRLLRPR